MPSSENHLLSTRYSSLSTDFSDAAAQSIWETAGSAVGYYVTFAIDADGDDRICTGDYRQNYNRTETPFFDKEDVGTQNLNVFVQEITEQSECEAF